MLEGEMKGKATPVWDEKTQIRAIEVKHRRDVKKKNKHLQPGDFLVSLFHLLPAFLESLARLTRSRHRFVPGHKQYQWRGREPQRHRLVET